MSKTYPITVRLTEEQKKFIDTKIASIKEVIDIDVPAGVIIRKFIEKAMRVHAIKSAKEASSIRHFMKMKFGDHYERRKEDVEELIQIIEEYNASEFSEQ